MFNIGIGELLLLFFIAFIVIGPKDLPKVVREIGRAVRYMKRLMADVMKSINMEDGDEFREVTEELKQIESELKKGDVSI